MLYNFTTYRPTLEAGAWVAESAEVIGRVQLGRDVSIWPQCVLRGDVVGIVVGERSNLQEFVMVHGNHGAADVTIGCDVTVGHRATLHGCRIGDRVLIGMGAIVLDDVEIESDVMVGAGALVAPRTRLESGGLYLGSPATRRRELRPEELEGIRASAYHYVGLATLHQTTERT